MVVFLYQRKKYSAYISAFQLESIRIVSGNSQSKCWTSKVDGLRLLWALHSSIFDISFDLDTRICPKSLLERVRTHYISASFGRTAGRTDSLLNPLWVEIVRCGWDYMGRGLKPALHLPLSTIFTTLNTGKYKWGGEFTNSFQPHSNPGRVYNAVMHLTTTIRDLGWVPRSPKLLGYVATDGILAARSTGHELLATTSTYIRSGVLCNP